MAFAENFRRQVALLLRTIPFIAGEKCFALKGSTAINLFLRDRPLASVGESKSSSRSQSSFQGVSIVPVPGDGADIHAN